MTSRRQFVGTLLSASCWTALGAGPSPAGAQAQQAVAKTGPLVKQLTIVVGFPPGGATDTVARLVGDSLRGTYAENVIVDNRAGAGGRIGTDYVRTRPADGSVMLYTPAFPLVIFPHIYKKLPYDALNDFVPVAQASNAIYGLVVGPAVPAAVKTARDFVAWCKANPEKSNYATVTGSSQHFAGVMFGRVAGFDFNPVPYKGGAPAVADLLGGHVSANVAALPEVIPYTNDGKLRVLAVTGTKRSRFLPNVPTMAEAGYRDLVFQDWAGFFAPARTPTEIVARANAAIIAYVGSKKGTDALAELSTESEIETVAEFSANVRSSWERYRVIVKSTGFVAED